MLQRRLSVLAFILALALESVGSARADDTDAIRTMLGLASLPNAQQRSEFVGTMPTGMLLIPQPTGLSLVGSVAALNEGKLTSEVVYYAAPAGSVPDFAGYQRQLGDQGWSVWSPPGIPSIPFQLTINAASVARTFCKTGSPTITVRADQQYLVVQANAASGLCSSPLMRRAAPAISKAPYPVFAPPDGAIFVGTAKQTFNGDAHIASIGLVSTQAAGVLVSALAKQMTDAGWKVKTVAASAPDSEAFSIRDTNGVDWVAALSVVQVGGGMYLFTASAFKLSETISHPVAVR
jgi:hypothetical protein